MEEHECALCGVYLPVLPTGECQECRDKEDREDGRIADREYRHELEYEGYYS